MTISTRYLHNIALFFFLCLASVSLAGEVYNPDTGRLDYCVTIEETDGSPSNYYCGKFKVPNGTLTDNSDSTFSLSISAGEADTLDTVSDRGATTNQTLTAGGFTTAGSFTDGVATLTGGSLTAVKLGTLTSNGFVKTSGSDGTLSVDTNTYLTGNQSITISGDVSGTGTTAITAGINWDNIVNEVMDGNINWDDMEDLSTGGVVDNDSHAHTGSTLSSIDISDDTNLAGTANEITLTGDTLSIATEINLGGKTSLEIPNGASPTVNATGEIAVDTTSDQFIFYGASAARVIFYKDWFSVVLESPADADAFLLFKAPVGITLTDIDCIVDPADSGESVVADIQECDATGDNCATVDATITCDNDGAADDGSFTNGVIDGNDWVKLDIGTVTGTVSWLTLTGKFDYTAD